MIRWLLILALLPFAVSAEPVTIRSGEHETFSRLVFSIDAGTDWNVRPTTGGYLLELSGSPEGFQTSSIFERIPRDRVLSVSQSSQNTLFLAVECQCYPKPFLWRSDRLVLDIIDGTDPDSVPVEAPVFQIKFTPPSDAPLELPNLLNLRNSTVALTFPRLNPALTRSLPTSDELQTTEAALIEGLARAATQGFLDPAINFIPNSVPMLEPEQVQEPIRDLPGPPQIAGQPGVGISTAMDRELSLIGDALEALTGQKCLPGDLFEIGNWADERAFHDQASALAEALAGEFGEEPREAQDALARLYIHFGFGAEARSVLATDPALSQSRQVLIELAGIVDDGQTTYPLTETQAGCPSAAALWAFYVKPTVLDDEDRNFILQQFFVVPQPLRGQIAPRLARKFIQIDDSDAASKVMRASANRDVDITHDVQAARALIAQDIGDIDQAIAVLTKEVDENARTTPESLIQLIELALAQGEVPQETDLALAATMRQEFRSRPIASELALAEASGRIQNGQYQTAFDLLAGREDLEALKVIDNAFAHLTRRASSAVFLEFGYGKIPDGLRPDTENEIARRMIDLGFPERATTILRGSAEREAVAERRYLRAEAAIGTQDFVVVIDELLGMTDPRARELRSRAYAGLGEHRAALAASNTDQEPENGARLQFRARAWERLAVEEDEVLSSFADAILTPSATTPAETLADRRAILVQSQESRRAVEGLLRRFDGTSP